MGPVTEMLRVGSVQLCAQSFGERGDPAILLIGGANSSMDWWETEFCAELAAGRRFVVRYDLRDTGQSVHYPPGEPDYGSAELVADAVGVLDAYGIRSACLMGISMGGAMAQLVALDHPDRVSSLVLVSTMAPGGPSVPMDEKLRAHFESAPEVDWSDPDAVVAQQIEHARALASASVPFDESGTRALIEHALGRTADVRASLTNHNVVRDDRTPWFSELGRIGVPTLVVHGAEDPLFPLPLAEAMVAEIPGATLLVEPRVGHEFVRRSWPAVIPAVLEISGG
jgi:pimeloyl-ACP methyl ester carboxylesterase